MMKKLILLICFATPLTALAHPGHVMAEQAHGFLHAEHLFILLAIALVIFFVKTIKK